MIYDDIVKPKISFSMRNFLGKNSFCLIEGQKKGANLYTRELSFLYFTPSLNEKFDPSTNI